MKSATLPKAEDKRVVRNALPSSNIFTAAVARLYITLPSDRSWKYSGLWGAVAFCKDRIKSNSYFIRLIDMETDQGVIWEQELYEHFEYIKDCSFFHTFETDDCLAGLLFVHHGEADVFHDKILNRENIKLKDNRAQKTDVGRVSYIPGKGFTVEGNDPEVLEILRELEKLEDFSAADIDQNQDFIQDFIRQYRSTIAKKSKRGPPPPPPPSRKRSVNNSNRSVPPPIPPMFSRTNPMAASSPPPPPVPNRGVRQSAPPPPPPALPAKNSPIPNHATAFGGPPPPPPPPPLSGSPVPPPPPPPPPGASVPSPPPPPPPGAPTGGRSPAITPPGGDGRTNLMAAIRSTGGIGSLKKRGSPKHASSAPPSTARSASTHTNGKADMASSLAAVLQQRKSAMQSDDEDDDDDDDWK